MEDTSLPVPNEPSAAQTTQDNEVPAAIATETQPSQEDEAVIEEKVVEKNRKEKPQTASARKQTSRFDMKFQAESILSTEGTKAISKCIESGNMSTAVFQEIAKLATEQEIKLRVKDSINKFFNFTPLLRSLHTIFPDLRYNRDILFFTAVREGEIPAVEYLLLHGKVDPLCRNGECLIEAYVERNNAPLTRLMLDYVQQPATSSFPLEVIEAAYERKDFHLVRQLLAKGSELSDTILSSWMQAPSGTAQWDQMRLFTRFRPEQVFRSQDGAIVQLCLVDLSGFDVTEQNQRREMFSYFISKGLNPTEFLTGIDQTKIDDFIKLMMSESSRGLFAAIMQPQPPSEENKKRKKTSNEEEVTVES